MGTYVQNKHIEAWKEDKDLILEGVAMCKDGTDRGMSEPIYDLWVDNLKNKTLYTVRSENNSKNGLIVYETPIASIKPRKELLFGKKLLLVISPNRRFHFGIPDNRKTFNV